MFVSDVIQSSIRDKTWGVDVDYYFLGIDLHI